MLNDVELYAVALKTWFERYLNEHVTLVPEFPELMFDLDEEQQSALCVDYNDLLAYIKPYHSDLVLSWFEPAELITVYIVAAHDESWNFLITTRLKVDEEGNLNHRVIGISDDQIGRYRPIRNWINLARLTN